MEGVFQSTLPREERRSNDMGYCTTGISIHAPTRGATVVAAPTSWHVIYFNPRSHERSDPIRTTIPLNSFISIHAPTRGATGKCSLLYVADIYFNPRSHERSDVVHIIAYCIKQFQSTLPREERPCPPVFYFFA